MDWLLHLYETNPAAHDIGIIAVVCVAGLALGSIKFRGIGLGTAGVLFAGIILGYFGRPVDHATLTFLKEFGLILFVFTIGLQLGPGFIAALRSHGLKLNALAAIIVLSSAVLAPLLGWLLHIDFAAVLGLFSGATTNTPSLGAAQQTLTTLPGISEDRAALPALAYAVTYPTAIAGIIGTLLLLKGIFRIDIAKEAELFAAEQRRNIVPIEHRTMVVENKNLADVSIDGIPGREEMGVVISRHCPVGEKCARAALGTIRLQVGDRILAVAPKPVLDRFEKVVGSRSLEDLSRAPGLVTLRRIVVTNKKVLGKTVGELGLDDVYGVAVSRITRADLEMTAVEDLQLQFGDMLHVVGEPAAIDTAAKLLGNSIKELNATHFIPMFTGIVLGIILGTLPIMVPGLPQPVRLGLAGGPLLVALLLGRVGRIGSIVWQMPVNANLAFREFGISLFFACVGLSAGPKFFGTVFSANGLLWLGAGLVITIVPLLAIGIFARAILKMNFMPLCGLVSGSMTDPPALAFANNISRSDAPTVAYATVYPLTTLLRILSAQILALTLCR